MSGFVFRKAIVTNKLKHEATTKLNIESVTMAIAAFVSICGRLPYPAHDASGLESEDPSPGYVPYKALGISEQTAKDGYSRPLIYIPEKKLIFSDDQGVYCRNELDTNCFCRSINMPGIEISGDVYGTIVAFAIDTLDHKNIINEDHIVINPSRHTFWISRDMLLMQYLKNAPCAYIKPHTKSQ